MTTSVHVSAAVEGIVDEAVVRRLIDLAGGVSDTVYGKNGKQTLRRQLRGYNNAARHAPWIVLADLDKEYDCAPSLLRAWIPEAAPHLCFRVVVRAVEAWLLADHETLASFLGITAGRVPREPETLDDPKRALVDLARTSRRRAIREDMVPGNGSGRTVGPAYASRIIEYVQSPWRPRVAAGRAESLQRTLACLERLIASARTASSSGDIPS